MYKANKEMTDCTILTVIRSTASKETSIAEKSTKQVLDYLTTLSNEKLGIVLQTGAYQMYN